MQKDEIQKLIDSALSDDKANFEDVYNTSRSSRSDVTPYIDEFEKLGAIVIVDFVTGDFSGDISSVSGDRQFHIQGEKQVYKLGATVLTNLSVQCKVKTIFISAKKKIELLSNPKMKKHIQMLKAAKSNVASKLRKVMIENSSTDIEISKFKAMKPSQVIAHYKQNLK